MYILKQEDLAPSSFHSFSVGPDKRRRNWYDRPRSHFYNFYSSTRRSKVMSRAHMRVAGRQVGMMFNQ